MGELRKVRFEGTLEFLDAPIAPSALPKPSYAVALPKTLAVASGQTFYVRATGRNTNSGTSTSAAWQSHDYAVSKVKDGTVAPGDTIDYGSGTFTANSNMADLYGVGGFPITFRGQPGTLLAVGGQTGLTTKMVPASTFYLADCGNLRFENFDFNFSGTVDRAVSVNTGCHDIEFLNCDFHDSQHTNCFAHTNTWRIHFRRCAFRRSGRADLTSTLYQGVYLGGGGRDYGPDCGHWVDRCVISDNASYGIQLYSWSDDMLVTNCVIYGNGKGCDRSGAVIAGDGKRSSQRSTWANNLFVSNGRTGGKYSYGLTTSWSGGTPGAGHVVDNCAFHANPTGDVAADPSQVTYTALGVPKGFTSPDPLFVNPATADFRMQAGSPWHEQAADEYLSAVDAQGTVCPAGLHGDVGAYET